MTRADFCAWWNTLTADAKNRLVAEKVVGCHVRTRAREGQARRYDLVVPGGVDAIDFVTPEGAWDSCPDFIGDMQHAWPLAEKLGLYVGPWEQPGTWQKGWCAQDSWMDFGWFGQWAPTAAEAICKEALYLVLCRPERLKKAEDD